jgi:BirA family biotin operon repressor/biotin-[acetyl-CoA-carboxylase] ligase
VGKIRTQDKVLTLLVEKKGEAVSGESLAEQLSVSRTAIWKAITSLREEGYSITAVTNKGYVLEEEADILKSSVIAEKLSPEVRTLVGNRIEVFQEIDSTNTEAKRRASNKSDFIKGSLLLAETQTAGRGRLGRTFYSPKQTGLYMSLLFQPDENYVDTSLMTACAAVAVCRALEKWHIKAQIKWVNDVFVGNKKVCGILTEGIMNMEERRMDAVVLGIGINIRQETTMPEELKNIVGFVKTDETKESFSRNELAAEVMNQVISIFKEPGNCDLVMEEYKTKSLVMNKVVTVISQNEPYEAKVIDITKEGHLIIETTAGEKKELLSGEVSIKPELLNSN